MTGRTYVLIFFFWAVLTVVTPTLILLSESSKPGFDLIGEESEGINKEKMITGLAEKHPLRTVLKRMARRLGPKTTTVTGPASAPVSARAPSPALSSPMAQMLESTSTARKLLTLTRFSQRQHYKVTEN